MSGARTESTTTTSRIVSATLEDVLMFLRPESLGAEALDLAMPSSLAESSFLWVNMARRS